MPYLQSDETFEIAIAEVLRAPDIRQAMDNNGASEAGIAAALRAQKQDAWASVAELINAYDKESKELEALQESFKTKRPEKSYFYRMTERIARGTLIALALLAVGFGVAWFLKGFVWIRSHATIDVGNFFVLVFASPFITSSFAWFPMRRRLTRKQREFDVPYFKKEGEVKEGLKRAKKAIEEGLISRKLKPEAQELLDTLKEPVFGRVLPNEKAEGLEEMLNNRFEITTASRKRVLESITTMRGASIGISGPRGVGKSTLLWSVCQSGETEPGTLSVFTSAPVQYDPRDFLLHLFSSVCSRVIEKQTGRKDRAAWRRLFKNGESLAHDPMRLIRGMARSAGLVGFVLLNIGLVLALVIGFGAATTQPSPTKESAGAASSSTAAASPSAGAASPDTSKRPATLKSVLTGAFKSLDLQPTPFILWGFVLWISAFAFGGSLFPLRTRRQRFRVKERYESETYEHDEKLDPVGKEAHQRLQAIRFLQSYSSGWSGGLKLPVGVEAGVNSAIEWSERQQTLPELVDEYKTFLKTVSDKYGRIILAVDELDKLESDEAAQRFLNGIKAIFGQPGCYYLVSVSQNAMSSFERRGMPLRDAFDSSFDEVLQLQYLNLDSARRLIARRVMNVPHPFVCFCYVMSGGLPRDLIRQCRGLFETARNDPSGGLREYGDWPDIYELCRSIVVADRNAKLTALMVEAQKMPLANETARFIERMDAGTKGLNAASVSSLLEDVEESMARLHQLPPPVAGEAAINEARHALVALHQELRSYLCFLHTVMHVFDTNLTEPVWKEHLQNGTFDRLARVREWMSVNQEVATLSAQSLRRDLGVPLLPSKTSLPAAQMEGLQPS